jgi:CheY-like chemotaxis protein
MHESIIAVLLDLTMLVMGDEEALRYLKLIDQEVPIILSSGYNEVETFHRFSGKGLAGFLQKPTPARLSPRRFIAQNNQVRSPLDVFVLC